MQPSLALYATRFGGVQALIQGPKAGITIVQFGHVESAYASAGVVIPIQGVGRISFTTGSRERDRSYTSLLPKEVTASLSTRCEFAKQYQKLTGFGLLAADVEGASDAMEEIDPPE